jgi:hypothetical protein
VAEFIGIPLAGLTGARPREVVEQDLLHHGLGGVVARAPVPPQQGEQGRQGDGEGGGGEAGAQLHVRTRR